MCLVPNIVMNLRATKYSFASNFCGGVLNHNVFSTWNGNFCTSCANTGGGIVACSPNVPVRIFEDEAYVGLDPKAVVHRLKPLKHQVNPCPSQPRFDPTLSAAPSIVLSGEPNEAPTIPLSVQPSLNPSESPLPSLVSSLSLLELRVDYLYIDNHLLESRVLYL